MATYLSVKVGCREIDVSAGVDADGDGLVDMPAAEEVDEQPK